MSAPFCSVFQQVFDVIVYGGGYAGFAAAREVRPAGTSVLLVARRPALLWESGWAFSIDVGTSNEPAWQQFVGELKRRGAADDRFIDGAVGEVVAAVQAQAGKPQVLLYATPIAAYRPDGLVHAVAFGTKAGVRILRARQWIDASDGGELLAVLEPHLGRNTPVERSIHLYFRHTRWEPTDEVAIDCPGLPDAKVTWAPAFWENQRVLSIRLPGPHQYPRSAWVPAIEALDDRYAGAMDGAVLSHGSATAFDAYSPPAAPAKLDVGNITLAVPGLAPRAIKTLADRFELGLSAARELAGKPKSAATAPPFGFGTEHIDARSESTEVAVAGAGTGGALAAIAAARAGAQTLVFDPLPYAGGIGAGGGIHWYYYGVKGGLQDEVDQRTRQIMPLFGKTQQVRGFHPDARKIVIEEMIRESGATQLSGATLYAVDKAGSRVTSAMLATRRGPVCLSAGAWIDATGDGDLCALAGVEYSFGRPVDGQLHAYSQSSGRVGVKNDLPQMTVVNYDAGFVDPIDPEDQTRGRLLGVSHYLQDRYSPLDRPTYIAPAIGLRQSRQIETDYMLTLADLIERREFPDSVGLTGAHYDNHATDYEFESDEGMFWVWCCRQWRGQTACQIPYRMLLPRGLDNVWVACRAAGVSPDAHHSMRMQRDMQRLGEVAGLAAALAVHEEVPARQIPYKTLKQQLIDSGAMAVPQKKEDSFGPDTYADLYSGDQLGSAKQVRAWIEELKAGPGPAMYHLHRAPKAARQSVTALLASTDEGISWRAATVAAMWSDAAAEARLLAAIRRREYGFAPDEKARPETNPRLAPHWLVAIALLRRCGTPACLRDLYDLSADPLLVHNARTALALTLQTLAMCHKLSPEQRNLVDQALRRLLSTPAPNSAGDIQRGVVPKEEKPSSAWSPRSNVREDFAWQLHLAVGKAEQAAGLPVHEQAKQFLVDPRALVRRAFTNLLQRY